eukprot:gene11258-13101_t
MISDDVIDSVAINLKQLRRLNLKSCRALTNASLDTLAIHCTSTLELLWLSGNDGIAGDAIMQLKNKMPEVGVHSLAVTYANDLVPSADDYGVLDAEDVGFMKNVLNAVGSTIAVIRNNCKESEVACLSVFPL